MDSMLRTRCAGPRPLAHTFHQRSTIRRMGAHLSAVLPPGFGHTVTLDPRGQMSGRFHRHARKPGEMRGLGEKLFGAGAFH